MKRMIAVILCFCFLLALCGCRQEKKQTTPNQKSNSAITTEVPAPASPEPAAIYDPCDRNLDLEDITTEFTLQDAAELGWYTQTHTVQGDIICENEDIFLEFYKVTSNGQPAIIRMANYYEGLDPNHTSYILYESYYDTYPYIEFSELKFDEAGYHISTWNPEKQGFVTDGTFKHLLHTTSTKQNGNVLSNETFFLCDVNTKTYEEIAEAMQSDEVYPAHIILRSVNQYDLPLDQLAQKEEAPYQISAEEAAQKSTTELVILALSDTYMIKHFMDYQVNGKDMAELVQLAADVHPYLREALGRDDFLAEMNKCLPAEYELEWNQVLGSAYRAYFQS